MELEQLKPEHLVVAERARHYIQALIAAALLQTVERPEPNQPK